MAKVAKVRISKQVLDVETIGRKDDFLASLVTGNAGKIFSRIEVDNSRMGIEHMKIVFTDGSSIPIGLCTAKVGRLSFEVDGISMLTYAGPLKEEKGGKDEE